MVLWLPRYYRDSIETIRAESIRTIGDKSFTGHVRIMLTSSSRFQRIKIKRRKKLEEREEDENKDKNIVF